MDFDQNIFSYFYKIRRQKKQRALEQRKLDHHAVELESLRESIRVYASAIFKIPIEIRVTDDFPYVSNNKIYLPSFIATENSQEKNYLFYRLLILHLYAVKSLSAVKIFEGELHDELSEINKHKSMAVTALSGLYPNYSSMLATLTTDWKTEEITPAPEPGKKLLVQDLVGFDRRILWGRLPKKTNIMAAHNGAVESREALPQGESEKENKAKGKINKVNLEEDKENIGQDVFHHFEKIETLEEFKGIQREMDGSDELEAHADALEELNLEEVIRSSKGVQSLYKTELDMGFEVADLQTEEVATAADKVFFYDEWDAKAGQYKKDWCRVVQSDLQKLPAGETIRKSHLHCLEERVIEINKIKKKLVQLMSEVQIKKKLFDGRSVDIDNYIRNRTLNHAKISGDGRFYQETIKRHRDVCTLLLVDNSLSSDSWVQNRRVLDVCLEALLVFGQASMSLGDPMMVAGFNSNTRNSCKFSIWKSFAESWESFKTKVDDVNPEGYTRIGPAIRHAAHLLNERPERHKFLLIFTDGRPTDYDRYEGQYGLSDVRKAIGECELQGIVPFAVAVDPTAKQFLPHLFGQGNYQILMNIKKFPETLSRFYIKMSQGK